MPIFLASTLFGALLGANVLVLRFAWQRNIGTILIFGEVLLLGALFVVLSTAGGVVGEPWIDLPVAELVGQLVPNLLGFVTGLAGSGLCYLVAASIPRPRPIFTFGFLLLVVGVGLLLAMRGISTQEPPPAFVAGSSVTPIASKLPPGFALERLLSEFSLTKPTAFAVGNNGDIFVATGGGVLLADDVSGDGNLDRLRAYAPDVRGALGLVFRDGALYVAEAGAVLRLVDEDGDGQADVRETLVQGLPSYKYTVHSNNGMAFGPDGRLYLTVGGTSDHGPEKDPFGGTILTLDLDRPGVSSYANGFRNPYDLAFCSDGRLFATDNGPDHLDDRLLFRPPDEVNFVLEGRHYGYPDFFGFPPAWSQSEAPLAILPLSSAATGITCYEGEAFPEEYHNNLFVTLWGSLVIPERTGHKVVRIELDDVREGVVVGRVSDFITGLNRPIDVLEYVGGSLIILDHEDGHIYRVVYSDGN